VLFYLLVGATVAKTQNEMKTQNQIKKFEEENEEIK